MRLSCRIRMCAVVLLLLLTPVTSAFGYSTIVAFGDSLSDNGNVAKLTDGPLWVELLTGHYGRTSSILPTPGRPPAWTIR